MASRKVQPCYNQLLKSKIQRQRQGYCSVLEIPVEILKNTQVNSKPLLKEKYAYKMRDIAFTKQANQRNKQKRVEINTAYQELSQFFSPINYSQQEKQLLNTLIQENTQKLKQILTRNPNLINYRFQASERPLIYFAVKTGCIETVDLILKMGCSIDFRNDTNTPMHCAVYYGHYKIIGLLLEYGVPINIKNKLSRLPIEQFFSDQIRRLFEDAQKDKINKLITELIEQNLCHSVFNFYNDEKIIGKRIILHSSNRNYEGYEDAYHGTSFNNLKSITKHGLRVPGQVIQGVQIKIVDGHLADNMKWAKAIFVSPSLLYSADSIYAKSITIKTNNKTETWLPLVQVKVKKGCYETKQSTVSSYKYKDDQPSKVQYRIEMHTAECRKKVIVVALLLIEKNYIESVKNYQQVVDMFLKKPL